jgi:hypothetical protein
MTHWDDSRKYLDIIVPPDVILAAAKVGRWFAERNINDWEVGPCKARFPVHTSGNDLDQSAPCSEPARRAETDGQKAGPSASCIICGRLQDIVRNAAENELKL